MLDEDKKNKVKGSLCKWIKMQYFEEAKKYDVENDIRFDIIKTFDFTCNVVPFQSSEKEIQIYFLFGINSTLPNAANPIGNITKIYKQNGSLPESLGTTTQMLFNKTDEHY